MEGRNLFLYWTGKEFSLIRILRHLIRMHSVHGKGYKVHLITPENLSQYISDIPDCFETLKPAHQADFVRVNVIYTYGGIWMDSDTLVLDSLDSVFDILDSQDGFFIIENNQVLWNGVFGSRKKTVVMKVWKQYIDMILQKKQNWTELGNSILTNIYNTKKSLFDSYTIWNGLDSVYPVNWNQCVNEYIEKPYDNYKKWIRKQQPFIVLVHSVYHKLEQLSPQEILGANYPLNYFLSLSLKNLNYKDLHFIEIGTSNFDTCIQECDNATIGISVEAIKYYLDQLPEKDWVKKIHTAVSDTKGEMDIYYIPEAVIDANPGLPKWLKGCNSINNYHPFHTQFKLESIVKKERVSVVVASSLWHTNRVRGVDYLKIDTEGHDCVILNELQSYLECIPKQFYPKKIKFESNQHTPADTVNATVELYQSIGYRVAQRGYDTVLVLEE